LITSTGKNILAKYLIGQVASYASYIAIGVGSIPKERGEPLQDFSNKKALDFEVLRVPIVSRGYISDDNGITDVVFSAELPTDQRYEITEVGVYPGSSNPAAGVLDSKMLYTFSPTENWKYHTDIQEAGIPVVLTPLNPDAPEQSNIVIEDKVFITSSNNVTFNNPVRISRYERPRFLDRVMMISGNLSNLQISDGVMQPVPSSDENYYASHIHLTGTRPPLDRNSPVDDLRLAFSVIDKNLGQSEEIDRVRVLVQFASTDSIDPDNFAKMQIDIPGSDFANNRYRVETRTLNDLAKSPTFTWNTINVALIYVSVFGSISLAEKSVEDNVATIITDEEHGFRVGEIVSLSGIDELFDGDHVITETTSSTFSFALESENISSSPVGGSAKAIAPSSKFFVALDGLRMENNTAENPIYGLVGYSVVRNRDARPFIKEGNSSNVIEFRFGMDVV
jgi:hypothetical protein